MMKNFLKMLIKVLAMMTISLNADLAYSQTTITDFPYFMSFEDATSIDDWPQEGGKLWQRRTYKVANYGVMIDGYQSATALMLPGVYRSGNDYDGFAYSGNISSPKFVFDDVVQAKIKLMYNMNSSSSTYAEGDFRIEIKSNNNDWVQVFSRTGRQGSTDTWYPLEIDLIPFLNNNSIVQDEILIRFIVYQPRGQQTPDVAIDAFEITDILNSGDYVEPIPPIQSSVVNLYDTYSGQISAIGQHSIYAPSRAFDNDTYTFWNYLDEDSWIQYDIPGCVQYELDEFQIEAYYDDYAPTKFWVYGAIEGGQWEEIHYSCCESWNNYQTKTFDVNSSESYGKFKLEVTDTEQGAETAIREIDLFGHIGYAEPSVFENYANSGSVSYHSGVNEYDNKTSKAWLIKPMDGSNVQLTFESFDFTCPSDYLRIYNGENRGAPLLGEYNMSSLPEVITSQGNALYLEFLTSGGNGTDLGQGFTASYVSTDLAQSQYPWTQVDDTGFILNNGRLGINTQTLSDEFAIFIEGGIVADELVIESFDNAPDYVFEEDYDLKSLQEVQSYIRENGHLPEVPNAKELEESGMSISEMNLLLLKKIEELTLHLINQQAQIDSLKYIRK